MLAALSLGIALSLSPGAASPPAYLNLSFEAPDPLDGWFANGVGFAPEADRTRAHSGATSLVVRYVGKGPYDPEGRDFANVSRHFPVADARGKTLRLTGRVRTENVSRGYAGFWCRVDGKSGTLAIDNMGGRGVTGTSADWTACEITMKVDAEATGVGFGAILAGDGAAWFDSIAFELDGVPYPQGEAPPATAPEPVVAWIRENAIPLRGAAAGTGLEDMRPLRSLVGDARIVSLGEATHGTREFFQWKHRMLEFLVTEMGFTIFAIEANAPECAAIDDYVMGKDVDPEKALDGIYFWTWNTEEVLDMMRWMRAYNADPAHEQKVRFMGFDAQTPNVAVDRTLAYFSKVDPESAAALREPLEALKRPKAEWASVPAETAAKTTRALADALALFDARKEAYVAKSSDPEWADARQCAVVARQVEEVLRTSNFAARDRAMAENVKWILDRAGERAKIVLWSHNGHASASGYAGVESMGVHLRREFGAAMVVIGFAFNRGSFQAIEMATSGESKGRGLREFTVEPAPPSSLDGTLAATGLPIFVLDLRKVPASGPVAEWFAAEQKTRSIGAVFSEASASAFFAPQSIRAEYDALFFVESTTRARPNASVRKRFKMDEAPAK